MTEKKKPVEKKLDVTEKDLKDIVAFVDELEKEDRPSLLKEGWIQLRDAALKVLGDKEKYEVATKGRFTK